MNSALKSSAFNFYLILAALFIASLVAGNLIFQKFFYWAPLQWLGTSADPESTWYAITHFTFEISVGIIPYPITFLITDLISEIYGRKRANQVVIAGLFATVFVFLIVMLANLAPATSWSPVGDEKFGEVFGLTGVAVSASMVAYLVAQFVDIRIFHFWKDLTKGKHLWLRNNFSTITSQLIDTASVLLLLCTFGAIEWSLFWLLLINGFLFKALVALLDTPLFYLTTWWARKKFKLKLGEEINLD
jgi:queuosine precursor transporter